MVGFGSINMWSLRDLVVRKFYYRFARLKNVAHLSCKCVACLEAVGPLERALTASILRAYNPH